MAVLRTLLSISTPLHLHHHHQFHFLQKPFLFSHSSQTLKLHPNSHTFLNLSSFSTHRFFTPCCSSSSMEAPPEGYRRNVGICLINSSKKIFSASRLDIPDSWQMPQGGIDEDEDPKNAAIRELREETGVTSVEVLAEVPYWLTYDFPPEVREKLKRQWGSDWKGQAQKWFLLKLLGNEDEINLLGDGTEKAEFGNWSWMTPDEVVKHAVDFKRPVYEEVLKVFAPYLQ
ncbi:nudix hydrolase 26, chloroplastic [Amaranthus tricolor]|uniref:nudix hydrolase 26, chloroplastic n=1 Tax=Amaranthus tricolor TaxID=29722 RepID=UPI0025906DC5|nr:nudix hydrolase 26, chloroplastic [Amaranthus tricolor]